MLTVVIVLQGVKLGLICKTISAVKTVVYSANKASYAISEANDQMFNQ